MTKFQSPHMKQPDLNDHVWYKPDPKVSKYRWKCCTCGAVTNQPEPPLYPTNRQWEADRYEPLTDEERIKI